MSETGPLDAIKNAKARIEEHSVGKPPLIVVCSPQEFRAVRDSVPTAMLGGLEVEFDVRVEAGDVLIFYDMQTYREWKDGAGGA